MGKRRLSPRERAGRRRGAQDSPRLGLAAPSASGTAAAVGTGAALLAPLPGGPGLSGGALPALPGLVRPGGLLLLGRGGFPALGGLPALPISVGAAATAVSGSGGGPGSWGRPGPVRPPPRTVGSPHVEHRLQAAARGEADPFRSGVSSGSWGLRSLGQLTQGLQSTRLGGEEEEEPSGRLPLPLRMTHSSQLW